MADGSYATPMAMYQKARLWTARGTADGSYATPMARYQKARMWTTRGTADGPRATLMELSVNFAL